MAPERKATKKELDGSKVGRKTRHKRTVEKIVEPTPDLDLIAPAFRKWANEKAIPFNGEGVEKTFMGFCKKFKAGV